MQPLDDTIVAIATPIGTSSLGVVRMSGNDAFTIANQITDIKYPEDHRAYHVWLKDKNVSRETFVDEAMVTYFKSPNSYTGEDVVEVSCHGSPVVLKRTLQALMQAGARQAEKGEFSKRAFLNGKINLLQAEAILSLISSKTNNQADVSTFQLKGGLSKRIEEIKAKCLAILTEIQASIDFHDDVEENPHIEANIKAIQDEIMQILSTYSYGKIVRNGINVAIAGKPNVGKSSLLNSLLKEERAIVTDEPGTTRDAIVESININGIVVNLIDTAGVRKARATAEHEGIKMAKAQIGKADFILFVLDGSEQKGSEDEELYETIKARPHAVIINKKDKGIIIGDKGIRISALTGDGVGEVEQAIIEYAETGRVNDGTIITTERQADCLRKANRALQTALDTIRIGMEQDKVSVDMQEAIEGLGEMLGIGVGEEVVNRVFSMFCVGK